MESKNQSLIEAINRASTFRKYYLIKRLKSYCLVKPHHKTIELPANKSDDIPPAPAKYIQELCDDFGYSLQLVIPDGGGKFPSLYNKGG